ncbi:MAG: DUF2007 domain-containing protein [Clostridia bacterium]|nr:DUF2007 domain-containing protein [Clostridia bacterium]
MKICHVCAFQCEDGDELCPICGAELAQDECVFENKDAVEEAPDIVIESPELAQSISDPILAEIFCDALKNNNILFTTDESDLSGSMKMGFGGFRTEINIYVDKEDIEKANNIFENLEIGEPSFDDDFFEEN